MDDDKKREDSLATNPHSKSLDKQIIAEKELNYIETLYLYCNIGDFISGTEMHFEKDNIFNGYEIEGIYAYKVMLDYLNSTMFPLGKYLGFAKGRDWYQLPNYRIGLMAYDTAKNANQYNCVIQYEQKHMFTLDKNLNGLDLPFDGSPSDYKIKRIDITKIAKHDEDYIEGYNYISPYRGKRYEQGTIYLGHRKNGNVFRIYNKTKELLTNTKEHPIDYKKIALLSEYFGDIENLYTYELELTRTYLKESLGIDTLADLDKVYSAYKNIVGKIRIYKDTDHNKRLVAQNKRERIKGYKLTDFVDYERVEKKHYSPSLPYLIKKTKKDILRYVDTMGLERNNDNILPIMSMLLSEMIDSDNKDMVITYEDTDLSDMIAKMRAKHQDLRDGQTDDLQNEAKRAFGTIKKQNKPLDEIEIKKALPVPFASLWQTKNEAMNGEEIIYTK